MNRAQQTQAKRGNKRKIAVEAQRLQKRERKRKIAMLEQYRHYYLKLVDHAIMGTQFRCYFTDTGHFDRCYVDEKPFFIVPQEEGYYFYNTTLAIKMAEHVRHYIRNHYINFGFGSWQLDEMEKWRD